MTDTRRCTETTTPEVTAQLVLGQALDGCAAVTDSLDFEGERTQRTAMPTIRDLVTALRRRDGVDAAIVLGRDGLLIDGTSSTALDPDGLAAHVPPLVHAAIEMGLTAQRGDFGLMVLEYARGSLVVTSLSADAVLLVLLRPDANLASLLYELRRHRAQLSALV